MLYISQTFILIFFFSFQAAANTYLKNGFILEGQSKTKTISQGSGEQLKIFWWNIAGQSFSWKPIDSLNIPKSSPWQQLGAVKGNIKNHTRVHSPDLIVLSEIKKSEESLFTNLLPEYFFTEFIPYRVGASRGILILSLNPLFEIDSGELSIFPNNDPKLTQKDRQDNYVFWSRQNIEDRPFSIFSIQANQQKFFFLPVHLVNPWPTYSIIYKGKTKFPGSGALTSYRVALKQMFLSETKKYKPKGQNQKINVVNPLHAQMKNLKTFLLDNLYNLEPLIIFGDFNSPSRIMPYGTPILDKRLDNPDKGHRLLEHHFKVPFSNFRSVETIPTEHGGKGKPKVRIDKAFTSQLIKTEKISIFKYSGSDHYPIQIIISQ